MRQNISSVTGAGTGNPIIIDIHGRPEVALQTVVSGTVNYTVQQTMDNILDPTITPTWFPCPVAAFVGATANQQGGYPYGYFPSAIRVVVNSGTGTVTLTTLQAGLSRA